MPGGTGLPGALEGAALSKFNQQFQRSNASPISEAPKKAALDGASVLDKYVAGEPVISTRHSEPSLHDDPSLPQSTQPSSHVAAPVAVKLAQDPVGR